MREAAQARAVWSKAREHRALNRQQCQDILAPARHRRDQEVDAAMAARDATIARADRMFRGQRETVVASLRKDLRRTKRNYAERIQWLGPSIWNELVNHALANVASALEENPWQIVFTTARIEMILWIEPARERAASKAAEYRRAYQMTVEAARRQFQQQLSGAYEHWHKERDKARTIRKWGRDRRQQICKQFARTGDAAQAIDSLAAMIREDETATLPHSRAREYFARQKVVGPSPTLPMLMRLRKRAA